MRTLIASLLLPFLLVGCSARLADPKSDSLRLSGLTSIEALRTTLFQSSAAIIAGQLVTHFSVDRVVDHSLVGHVEVADHDKPYATGCASAIGPERYLTAAHVVDNPPITVLRIDRRGQAHAMPATVVWSDRARDLAVVSAPGCPDEPSLVIAEGPPHKGDIVAIQGSWGSLSAGPVVDVDAERWRFLCTAPTVEGDSGGAIVDRQGRLLGVISGGTNRNGVDYTKGALVVVADEMRLYSR